MFLQLEALTAYLINNYDLQYHYYTHKFDLPHCVRLELIWDDKKIFSWGVANSKDLAFFKALIEMLERIALLHCCSLEFSSGKVFIRKMSYFQIRDSFDIPFNKIYPKNTNGCACDFSFRRARNSAFYELLERHVILCALLTRSAPEVFIHKDDIKLELKTSSFYWRIQNSTIAVTAIPFGSGHIFGYSASPSLTNSVNKSFEEALSSYVFHSYGQIKDSKCSDVVKDNIDSFAEYWLKSGDRRANDFLENKLTQVQLQKIPELKNIYYSRAIFPPNLKKFTKNLICLRAISPTAQQLFFDNWDHKYVNSKVLKFYELPEFPHFIS